MTTSVVYYFLVYGEVPLEFKFSVLILGVELPDVLLVGSSLLPVFALDCLDLLLGVKAFVITFSSFSSTFSTISSNPLF